MRILALDIGVGTLDALLYDSERTLENCTRVVLPSPTRLLARRVEQAAAEGWDIFITGYTVGGGPFSRAVKRALAAGKRVFMTPAAALSIRNNLEDVTSLGVRVVNSPPPGFSGTAVTADELDLGPLGDFLSRHGEDLGDLDGVAVAVQDHGTYVSGESNRKTRLRNMRERLAKDPRPAAMAYLAAEVPDDFPRLASAARRTEEQFSSCPVLVMDTAPAAVAGCLADPRVSSCLGGHLLLINAGNGHTLACILSGGKVVGVLEHHTHRLEPRAFAGYLRLFCDGEARDEDSFMGSGHGLFYLDRAPGWANLDLVAVTGPNRGMLEEAGLDPYFPAPGGDMMMTGPLGLVRAFRERLS
ncbi:MAG: DUF1786 family protein [Actinomycetota bacterium]